MPTEKGMERFNAYVDENAQRFIEELKEMCAQPSIAAQNLGMREMAELVSAKLEKLGAEVRFIQVDDGPPVVFAEIGEGKRTLLVYNHYDVQPPDPLEEWESPPFEPTIREGKLFARGVADDKGDFMARIQAIEAYQAVLGELPLGIKFVVEGEEEVGSPHLASFAQENRDLIEADGCLWETGSKDEADRFVIYLGLKGMLYLEFRAKGAKSDLHSSFATLVPNPAWRLVQVLSTLKDEEDRIAVDGLLDQVAEPSQVELEMLKAIPFEEERMKSNFGIPKFVRDLSELEALKEHLYGPTCNICGFKAGYIEEGVKTVLPNKAMVKIDFRLVPNLTPDLVLDLLRKHLDRHGFSDVEVVNLVSEHPAKTPIEASIVKAATAAAEEVYGQAPVVYPTHPATGPMYPLCQAFGVPAILAGIGYPGANIHAPNENVRLADYIQGIKFVGELIQQFGA